MTSHFGAALYRATEHRAAAWHGRKAGKAGLSVEEAADTSYLVGLRRRLHTEWAVIAESLVRQAAQLESSAQDAEAVAKALRDKRVELVAKARASAQARTDRYEELCAVYGRSWRRTHRDRTFAHIGWRCPRVPDPDEVIRHDQ